MIISLAAYLFDWEGDYLVEADQDSTLSHVGRRVSRSATLDGGCVIVDNGYTASDATFTLIVSDIDNITRLGILGMIQRHSLLVAAFDNNVFLGAVETVEDTRKLKIRFLVKQQLNV